jgi:4-oxalocrotonate tautomerase
MHFGTLSLRHKHSFLLLYAPGYGVATATTGDIVMPLVRIDLRRGKSGEFKRTLTSEIYQAMHEAFGVPENDRFMVINEHDEDNFAFDRNYLDIERSDDFVLIQLTVSNTRNLETKQAFYARLVERLSQHPGLRPQDVFINLVEVQKENWSFGNGIAQYVV